MENTPILKSVKYTTSDDLQWVRVTFCNADHSESHIALPSAALRGLVGDMIKFTTLLHAQMALTPDQDAAPEQPSAIPPTESALLVTKTLDLVRWQAGGALLRAQTTDGMAFHLGLLPEHVEFLSHTLARELPT